MTPSQQRARTQRIRAMVRILKNLYPTVGMALDYSNDWELAVAVILSAQTTDKQVNTVTNKLFKKYTSLDQYANAPLAQFQKDISSIGLYKSKGKHIKETAQRLRLEYGGVFPDDIHELMKLPGIGRKTATVLMAQIHNKPVGITVDTHVRRFAIRFDLSDYKDPARIEKDLLMLLPKKEWVDFTFRLISYGRDYCPARKHDCQKHPLTTLYPKANKIWPKSK